jgi:hypothetical protein
MLCRERSNGTCRNNGAHDLEPVSSTALPAHCLGLTCAVGAGCAPSQQVQAVRSSGRPPDPGYGIRDLAACIIFVMNPMSMVHDSPSTNACPMCPGDPVRRPPQHQDQNQYCGTADTAVLATDAAHAVGPTSPTLIRSAPRIWSKSALLDNDWPACFRPTEPPPTRSDWDRGEAKVSRTRHASCNAGREEAGTCNLPRPCERCQEKG